MMNLFYSMIILVTEVDTTSVEYQKNFEFGQQIGTYLPVTVILIIAIFVIAKQYKRD